MSHNKAVTLTHGAGNHSQALYSTTMAKHGWTKEIIEMKFALRNYFRGDNLSLRQDLKQKTLRKGKMEANGRSTSGVGATL